MTGSLRCKVAFPAALLLVCLVHTPLARAAPDFTASAITAPPSGDQLFYDADTQSGDVVVQGTVSPGVTTTGTLICWSGPRPYLLARGVPVLAGSFSVQVSLAPVAGQTCRLAFVPSGVLPSADALASFIGPPIVVSEQQTLSGNGNVFGYNLVAGDASWSFALDSLGGDALGAGCPIAASDSTDPTSFGSYSLFYGNACLPVLSGLPPAEASRSALQVGGQNAYAPGAIPLLSGRPGFAPVSYGATWDLQHDTVSVADTETPVLCTPPAGYPPAIEANCPSFVPSGIQIRQSTTLLPGDQVARVSQTYLDVDGVPHTLDLLVSQSIHAYASGQAPGFEFPGQSQFAAHADPDSYAGFPSGPGSIYVIADAAEPPSLANPLGAITYDQPPLSAQFVTEPGAQTATLEMHYVTTLSPGGSFTVNWAFSQAASGASLGPIVQLETDRFYTPTIEISAPAAGLLVRRAAVTVAGAAHDPEGITAVAVDGREVPVGSEGSFTTVVPLRLGTNTIEVSATNLAGVSGEVQRQVVYTPAPCVVPRLRGRTLARARRILHSHGCAAGRVVHMHTRRVRRGRVISSSPRSGSRRAHGAPVLIELSAGAQRAKRGRTHRPRRPGRSHRTQSGRGRGGRA